MPAGKPFLELQRSLNKKFFISCINFIKKKVNNGSTIIIS